MKNCDFHNKLNQIAKTEAFYQ